MEQLLADLVVNQLTQELAQEKKKYAVLFAQHTIQKSGFDALQLRLKELEESLEFYKGDRVPLMDGIDCESLEEQENDVETSK